MVVIINSFRYCGVQSLIVFGSVEMIAFLDKSNLIWLLWLKILNSTLGFGFIISTLVTWFWLHNKHPGFHYSFAMWTSNIVACFGGED